MKRFQSKNIGYIFHKEYYADIFQEKTSGKYLSFSDLIREEEKTLQKKFEESTASLLALSENYPKDYGNSWLFEAEKNGAQGIQSFELKVVYPGLLIGIGNPHGTMLKGDIKVGMSFDSVTGLPFVSGSSLKGRLRSIFEQLHEGGDSKEGDISLIGIETYLKEEGLSLSQEEIRELTLRIFEGLDRGNPLPIRDRDVFYGAMVVPKTGIPFLKEDAVTPHSEIFKNPVPIKLLAIAPQTTLRFYFSLKDTPLPSGERLPAETKLKIFRKVLEDFGIGAKTNVGYGVLSE